jgi:tetratricopeptide (TPR) repeat protein
MGAAASEQNLPGGSQSSDTRPKIEKQSILSMRTQGKGKRDYPAIIVFAVVLTALTATGVYFSLNLEREILSSPLESISKLVKKVSRHAKDIFGEFDNARQPKNKQTRLAQKYVRRGYNHYKEKRFSKARQELDKAIEINPENSEAYFWRARTLIKMVKYDEAVMDLKKGIDLKPEYGPAYDNLGWLLILSDNYEESLYYLNRSIELKPDNAWAHFMRGRVFYKMGDIETALENAQTACKLGFKDACEDVQQYESQRTEN